MGPIEGGLSYSAVEWLFMLFCHPSSSLLKDFTWLLSRSRGEYFLMLYFVWLCPFVTPLLKERFFVAPISRLWGGYLSFPLFRQHINLVCELCQIFIGHSLTTSCNCKQSFRRGNKSAEYSRSTFCSFFFCTRMPYVCTTTSPVSKS